MPHDMHPDSPMPGESFPAEAPLAGEPDGYRGGHALSDARRPEGVVQAKRTPVPAGQIPGRAAPSQAGAGRLDPSYRTAGALTPRPAVTSQPGRRPVASMSAGRWRALRGPVIWGAVVGVLQAASPLGLWWLEPQTVYALGLPLIAAVYIGFSVADGRWKVIAVESTIVGLFVVVAAMGVSGSAWLLVLGLAGHGVKDLWQHRTQFVRNTRWWPPFCATVDWVVAGLLTAAILLGISFHG